MNGTECRTAPPIQNFYCSRWVILGSRSEWRNPKHQGWTGSRPQSRAALVRTSRWPRLFEKPTMASTQLSTQMLRKRLAHDAKVVSIPETGRTKCGQRNKINRTSKSFMALHRKPKLGSPNRENHMDIPGIIRITFAKPLDMHVPTHKRFSQISSD